MAVIKARDYDFFMNNDEEVMLIMNGLGGIASESFIALKKNNAMLFRSPDYPQITLDKIPDSIREKLKDVPQILVCELDADGEPQQIYDAAVLKNA